MKHDKIASLLKTAVVLSSFFILQPQKLLAHCDGMDGPADKATQRAFATSNINRVLIRV